MKTVYLTFLALLSLPVLGQIQQDVNKTSGTVSYPINDIDSIRFNGSATEMEVVLDNGNIESHTISDIDNVTFLVPTAIVDVINPTTNKTWMDRNLGASQTATTSTDANAYGSLYQWGRYTDGHQKRTSDTNSILSNNDTPGHGDFIISGNYPYDWRSPQNDNLWQGSNGTNNPCPAGYRLPTYAEWEAERASWSSNGASGAFGSPLKLTMGGFRSHYDGTINDLDVGGYYWSSTFDTNTAFILYFNNSVSVMNGGSRATGHSVRCIKD